MVFRNLSRRSALLSLPYGYQSRQLHWLYSNRDPKHIQYVLTWSWARIWELLVSGSSYTFTRRRTRMAFSRNDISKPRFYMYMYLHKYRFLWRASHVGWAVRDVETETQLRSRSHYFGILKPRKLCYPVHCIPQSQENTPWVDFSISTRNQVSLDLTRCDFVPQVELGIRLCLVWVSSLLVTTWRKHASYALWTVIGWFQHHDYTIFLSCHISDNNFDRSG